MDKGIFEATWRQFGASIDMLENAIQLCPEEKWDNDRKFWYWSYHCLFWLDYYLTLDTENFSPPAPFGMSEFKEKTMPERTYTKAELLEYLQYSRKKCYDLIDGLTAETVLSTWKSGSRTFPLLEILLYNMRHVQHHAAQLNLILRQEISDAPRWVSKAK